MRVDSCIGAVSMASQVLTEAEGDGPSGLTTPGQRLTWFRSYIASVRLSEMDDALRRAN